MYGKFINFLKEKELYDEEVFNYMKDRIRIVKYNETSKDFFGCYPIVDENNILRDIKICVPNTIDDITVSINIHEYVHYLLTYRSLNKEYKEDKYAELMPVFYELSYLKQNQVNDYYNYYIEHIKEKDNYLTMLLNIFEKDNKKELIKE